nr:reverse transcriptase domain-containing protein [Tanacetum cinerariifolium]
MKSQSETSQTVFALKLSVLKTREYELLSMRMKQYLTFTNHALWEVIVNGNSVSSVASANSKGLIPPKTTEQRLARKNKLKSKSTLMLAILDEHQTLTYMLLMPRVFKFHAAKCNLILLYVLLLPQERLILLAYLLVLPIEVHAVCVYVWYKSRWVNDPGKLGAAPDSLRAITADNFELKHGLLTLVQNKQFYGHDKEDPHAHIRYFNKITSTLKFPNVPNTEACDRFKDLLRACPHHGFLELHQLDRFYNALNSKDQDSLNSAAGGNFLDKMPRECLSIIESKSKVRYTRDKPIVAKVSTNASTFNVSPSVAKLKDMVKALLLDKKGPYQSPAPMKAVEESCVTCGGAHSYRNCPTTNGNVYRNNIQEFVSQASAVNYNQGNTSYRHQMMSNQIRPPGFPPVPNNQNIQRNNQNCFIPNQNR